MWFFNGKLLSEVMIHDTSQGYNPVRIASSGTSRCCGALPAISYFRAGT